MTKPNDVQLSSLRERFEKAFTERGVIQEILLLRFINRALEHFATSESDWRAAKSPECRAWRGEISTLLQALDFMVSSAEAYAQEAIDLSGEVKRLREKVSKWNPILLVALPKCLN